jgi:hypothetical protein
VRPAEVMLEYFPHARSRFRVISDERLIRAHLRPLHSLCRSFRNSNK